MSKRNKVPCGAVAPRRCVSACVGAKPPPPAWAESCVQCGGGLTAPWCERAVLPGARCVDHPGEEQHADLPAAALVPGAYFRVRRNPVAFAEALAGLEGLSIAARAERASLQQAAIAEAEIATSDTLDGAGASSRLSAAVASLHKAAAIASMPRVASVEEGPLTMTVSLRRHQGPVICTSDVVKEEE